MDCRIKSGNDDRKREAFRRRGRRGQVHGTVRRRKVRSEAERQGEQLDAVEKISLRAYERLALCSARTRSMPRRMSLSMVVSVDAANILSPRQTLCGK